MQAEGILRPAHYTPRPVSQAKAISRTHLAMTAAAAPCMLCAAAAAKEAAAAAPQAPLLLQEQQPAAAALPLRSDPARHEQLAAQKHWTAKTTTIWRHELSSCQPEAAMVGAGGRTLGGTLGDAA